MNEKNFLKNYFSDLNGLLNNEEHHEKLINIKDILLKTHKIGRAHV